MAAALKIFATLATIGTALVLLLTFATLTATARSQERTACLKAGKLPCPQPAAWEDILRRVVT